MEMTFSEWKEKYNPERIGENIFVKSFYSVKEKPENHIWTVINDNEGGVYIVTGFHFVNEDGYIFTNNAWEDYREDDIELSDEDRCELN